LSLRDTFDTAAARAVAPVRTGCRTTAVRQAETLDVAPAEADAAPNPDNLKSTLPMQVPQMSLTDLQSPRRSLDGDQPFHLVPPWD
jgi:hypothetical protein